MRIDSFLFSSGRELKIVTSLTADFGGHWNLTDSKLICAVDWRVPEQNDLLHQETPTVPTEMEMWDTK